MQLPALAAPWPTLTTLLAVDRTRLLNVGRRLRLGWAMSRSQPYHGLVDAAVESCPWVWHTLKLHPILFRPLTSGYLDARWCYETRMAAYAHDLRFTSTRLHRAFPGFFPAQLQAELWREPDQPYAIVLDLNLDHPQEGLWRLSLEARGERIFSLCFSVVPGPALFVGGVQGGRSTASVCMVDAIRAATKAFDGLRPHHLLFDVIRTLAAAWGIQTISGIPSRRQLKVRSSGQGREGVRFSYDDFFVELGAQGTARGLWNIPAAVADRGLADAPSRKRAMYRRRHSRLVQLREAVRSTLTGGE